MTILPFSFYNYNQARDLMQFDKLEQKAIQMKVVSKSDINKWHRDLESKDKIGNFYALGFMFVAIGEKP